MPLMLRPGESADTFSSVQACIEDFACGWMSQSYLDPSSSTYSGGFLGNKGSGLNVKYASDPYWGEKAANIAYNLDQAAGIRIAETIPSVLKIRLHPAITQ